jgi:phosphomannomutase/phosphoglucomutase
VAQLQRDAQWPGACDVITLDGVRVEYADGFGLVRASNTTPVLVLRFEAEDADALHRIQQSLGAAIRAVRPNAMLPF